MEYLADGFVELKFFKVVFPSNFLIDKTTCMINKKLFSVSLFILMAVTIYSQSSINAINDYRQTVKKLSFF